MKGGKREGGERGWINRRHEKKKTDKGREKRKRE